MPTQTLQIGNGDMQVKDVMSFLSRYQLMPQLLRGMIIDKAIASFGCTKDEVKSAILRFEIQYQLTSDSTKKDWLSSHCLTEKEMEELAIRSLLIEKFQVAQWGNKLEPYFLKRKSHLDRVIYSIIKISDPGLVQELYFRILEGEESFTEIARQYSQGKEADTRGLLGPLALGKVHPAIRQLLCVSQPGQIWSPRKIDDSFCIIRLEKLLPAQLDEPMRKKLLSELFEDWVQAQIKSQIKQLNVNKTEENLAV
jgi:parvulin-like peptidyl-prolyl isomerase